MAVVTWYRRQEEEASGAERWRDGSRGLVRPIIDDEDVAGAQRRASTCRHKP